MRLYFIGAGCYKLCKNIGKEIEHLERKKDLLIFQRDRFQASTPELQEIAMKSFAEDIAECDRVREVLLNTYKEITGSNYRDKASARMTVEEVQGFIRNHLYFRGITDVSWTRSGTKNGYEIATVSWTEKV